MDDNGWIKLFRKFRDWGWYKDANTLRVWLEMLLTANYEDKEWMGVSIKRGQTIIGRKELAKNLGLSEQNVRTALTRLKSTNEITIKSYSKFSVVTINKYNDYQEITSNPTSIQPASNQHLTTPKEYKNIRSKEVVMSGNTSEDLKLFITKWNSVFGTKYQATKKLAEYFAVWRKEYSVEDIVSAVDGIKLDKFWHDKQVDPMWFFRFKDKNGDVDRIGYFLNLKPEVKWQTHI